MIGQTKEIGNYMQVDENATINYNKDITVTDLDGNTKIVCKCYCTILGGKTITYHMTVEDFDIYHRFKDQIQVEINKYKEKAIQIAEENNVPII